MPPTCSLWPTASVKRIWSLADEGLSRVDQSQTSNFEYSQRPSRTRHCHHREVRRALQTIPMGRPLLDGNEPFKSSRGQPATGGTTLLSTGSGGSVRRCVTRLSVHGAENRSRWQILGCERHIDGGHSGRNQGLPIGGLPLRKGERASLRQLWRRNLLGKRDGGRRHRGRRTLLQVQAPVGAAFGVLSAGVRGPIRGSTTGS